jgi:hypothetical protein
VQLLRRSKAAGELATANAEAGRAGEALMLCSQSGAMRVC